MRDKILFAKIEPERTFTFEGVSVDEYIVNQRTINAYVATAIPTEEPLNLITVFWVKSGKLGILQDLETNEFFPLVHTSFTISYPYNPKDEVEKAHYDILVNYARRRISEQFKIYLRDGYDPSKKV